MYNIDPEKQRYRYAGSSCCPSRRRDVQFIPLRQSRGGGVTLPFIGSSFSRGEVQKEKNETEPWKGGCWCAPFARKGVPCDKEIFKNNVNEFNSLGPNTLLC